MKVALHQIYYHEDQRKELYPFAIPYKNETVTALFENGPIVRIIGLYGNGSNDRPACGFDGVHHGGEDSGREERPTHCGVASWRLRQKRSSGQAELTFKRMYGDTELTEERITAQDYDIAILTPVNHKDMISKLMQWHQNAKACLDELRKFIRIPDETPHVIYENHFIARREIYVEYVETCLKPAIEFIGEKEVFKAPSGYRQKKERLTSVRETNEILARLGMTDWPMTPFILERLFSIWIANKNFKVVSI